MIFHSIVVISSAVVTGAVLGYLIGFCMASHNDVIAGVRPRTESKFLRFLARPTATLSSAEKIMFAPLMIFWVPMFFGLFAIPAIIGNALSVDDNVTVKVTYAVLSGALLIARKFGKRAWNALV